MDAFLFHSTSRSLYPEVMADLATLDSETFYVKIFSLESTLFSSVPTTIFLRKKVAKAKKRSVYKYRRFCNFGVREFFYVKKFQFEVNTLFCHSNDNILTQKSR